MTHFYEARGDAFHPTELTRGPWSPDHQHGGPPAALLGRALARVGDGADDEEVVRFQVELFRPVPLAPLSIEARVTRPGRSLTRAEAVLRSAGQELARATALRIRRRPLALEDAGSPAPAALPAPDALPPFVFPFFTAEVGYHRAVDARFARGAWGERDVVVWARPTAALVAGEVASPLERVLVIADAESGICPPLPVDAFTFLNPDLTVYLERPLEGDWLGVAARSGAHASGVGLAESQLFDPRGVIGRAAQSLVVAAR